MAYVTPKTNWAAGDIPVDSDLNRIEGNTKANHDAIEAEALARTSADATLSNDLDAEEAARIAADTLETNTRTAQLNGTTAVDIKLINNPRHTTLPTPGPTWEGRFFYIESEIFDVDGGLYFCQHQIGIGYSDYRWVKLA